MKRLLLIFTLFLASCASIPEDTSSIAANITPIDQTSLEVKSNLTFLPSLSGYYFPAGTYLPVAKDAHGVFYQSPKGIKGIGLGDLYYPVGGIYRFRTNDGSLALKNWQGTPKIGFLSRYLYDMWGANFSENLVLHE
jgi:hypothetical protein